MPQDGGTFQTIQFPGTYDGDGYEPVGGALTFLATSFYIVKYNWPAISVWITIDALVIGLWGRRL